MNYAPRVVDRLVANALGSAGAVVLRGPRAVGKTRTAQQFAASSLFLDSADPLAALAREQPQVVLEGATPRLLDEWQVVPEIWNEVRHEVDARGQAGQFILSGSAIPPENDRRHSGAGRFRQIMMRTMSFFETGHSTGEVSLAGIFENPAIEVIRSQQDFGGVVERIVTGGWPGWRNSSERDSADHMNSYISDIAEHDFVQVAGTRRDPRRLIAYLRAIATMTAQPSSYATLTARMAELTSIEVGPTAASQLHDLASRLFLLEDQPGWAPKLRSKTAALQTPKRHLADPSAAAALLGARSDRLLSEPETLGFIFESQVIHDLRVYAQAMGAREVAHYRDVKGRDEIDVIVENERGDWLAIEVKLGAKRVEEAADQLLRVTQKMVRPPTASIVIVPTGIAHMRKDGVLVVPLTVLGP